MGRTVKELLASIDSKELAEWMAYYQIQPFGEEIKDMRAGIIAEMLANIHRRRGSKEYSWRDFFGHHRYRAQTPEQQIKLMKAMLGHGNTNS